MGSTHQLLYFYPFTWIQESKSGPLACEICPSPPEPAP